MEWNTNRCLRTLRPLKTKLYSLRSFTKNFANKQPETADSEDHDSSLIANEHSLILEDHIKPYKKSKTTYKRRKLDYILKDGGYCGEEEGEQQAEIELSMIEIDQWELQKKIMDAELWKYLDDVFKAFKSIIVQFYDTTPSSLKLVEKCAFEIGINIGLNDPDSNLIQENVLQEREEYILEWYNGNHSLTFYRKWVMLGHSIGLLFSNLDMLEGVIEHIIKWSKSAKIEALMIELYIETMRPNKFWDKFENLQVLCEQIGSPLEGVLIKNLHLKVSDLSSTDLEIVEAMIEYNHRTHYKECLNVISQIISVNCEKLQHRYKLLETLESLSIEQIIVINQLSQFIKISTSNHHLNNIFLNKVYTSLKLGFRSLIPSLKIIKLFINNKKPPQIITNHEQLRVLKIIFKPHYHQTMRFRCLFLMETDKTLGLIPKASHKQSYRIQRSRISTGDLI